MKKERKEISREISGRDNEEESVEVVGTSLTTILIKRNQSTVDVAL
jgi:hypothetical protein